MKKILEEILENSDALNCIWGKIPDDFKEQLIKNIIQGFKDEGFCDGRT